MAKKGADKSVEQARLRMRESALADLRQRYARFGDEIVQFLAEYSAQPGGLRRILSRVLQPLPLDEERMHEALVRFLSTEGVATFFAWVEPGKRDAAAPRTPDPENDDAKMSAAEYQAAMGLTPQTATGDSGAVGPPPHQGAGSPSSEDTVSVLDLTEAAPGSQPTVAEGPWDGVERRSGLERRTGLERRSGRDRRVRTEMVFKNRRFGPGRRTGFERRSGRDRRKEPPPANTP